MTSILPKTTSVKWLKRLIISETSRDSVLLALTTSVFPLEEFIVVILQTETRNEENTAALADPAAIHCSM